MCRTSCAIPTVSYKASGLASRSSARWRQASHEDKSVLILCVRAWLVCLRAWSKPRANCCAAGIEIGGVLRAGNAAYGERAKLAVKVRLMLGEVSVSAFTEALSQQTGLAITAAPPLRERTVIVRFKDVSALAALSALAELNDWTWREVEPGQIVLRRRILQVPQEPTFIPRLIQNALPVDLREYLRVPRPSENRHVRADPGDRPPMDRVAFNEHLTAAAFGALHDLRSTLSTEDLAKTKLPYSEIDTRTKETAVGRLHLRRTLRAA